MKQTRGAITMLLAHLKAIFKHAYLKNVAVAAALATTVTVAYADEGQSVGAGDNTEVTKPSENTGAGSDTSAATENAWTKASKVEGGLNGEDGKVLNLQESIAYEDTPETVTITGGTLHKIGGENTEKIILFSEQKFGDPDLEALYKTNKKNLVINASSTEAKLTIANGTNDAHTGVDLGNVTVAGSDGKTATLDIQNKPANLQNYDEDKDFLAYTSIGNLTIKKDGVVKNSGELDVNANLVIEEGGKLTSEAKDQKNSAAVLWLGRDSEIPNDTATAITVKKGGILTSSSHTYIDTDKLTVEEGATVTVSGNLHLANENNVNVDSLLVDNSEKGDFSGVNNVEGKTLTLRSKLNSLTIIHAQDLTLGSDKYENGGLVNAAIASAKLNVKAKEGAYKIGTGESVTLNTKYDFPSIDYASNDGTEGTVTGDLDVDGGTLTVQAGNWTAQGVKVTDGTAQVSEGAGLAVTSLDIANGKTLTVAADSKADDGVDSRAVLDLTNATLVNDTTVAATGDIKGTIANSGIVKIKGSTLADAISNVEGAAATEGDSATPAKNANKGHIFDNKANAEIQVSGDTTLATGAFLASGASDTSGIKNAGTLAVDGALTVEGAKDAASELANAGTIKASSLQLNGKAGGAEKAADDSKFTLADGNFDIAGAVTANTDTLVAAGNVKAQSIDARILEITGQVGADKANVETISATDSLTTAASSTVFADSITAGSIDFDGNVTAGKVTSSKGLTVTAGTHELGDVTDTSEAGITVTDGTITVGGVLQTAKLTQSAGSLTVKGALNATEATLKGTTLEGATANIDTLIAATANDLALNNTSTATVGSFDGSSAAAGTVAIGEGSTLSITATQTATTKEDSAFFKNNATGDAIKGAGTLAVNATALDLKQNGAKDDYVATNKFAKDSIGVLKINGADTAIGADKINSANLTKLVTALSVSGSDNFNGKLQLEGVTADIGKGQETSDAKNGSYEQNAVAGFNQLAGDTTLQSVTVDAGDGTSAVSGDVGNLVANKDVTSVSIAEATLQGTGSSAATNGYYVSALKSDTGDDSKAVVLAGAELADANSSLTLAGQGKIGAVTAKNAGEGTLAVTGSADVVKLDTNGKEVATDIGSDTVALAKVNVSGALTAADIYTTALESSGSVTAANVKATNATVKSGALNVGSFTSDTQLTMEAGSLTATKDDAGATGVLDLAKADIKSDASIKAEKLTASDALSSAGNISVADIIEAGAAADFTGGNVSAKSLAVTGALKSAANIAVESLTAANTADLTGGIVSAKDVTFGGAATIKGDAQVVADSLTASTNNITVGADGTDSSSGFLFTKKLVSAGTIFVDPEFTNDTALAGTTYFGTTDADKNKLVANLVVGKKAIFAYDENLTAEQLKSLSSKYNLSDAEDGIGSLLVVNSAIDLNGKGITVDKAATSATTATVDTLTLGTNGAVAVGGTALTGAEVNSHGTQTAAIKATTVTYDKTSKVILDGSDIKNGASYQIFSVDPTANATSTGAKLYAQTLNGFFKAEVGTDGKTGTLEANRSVLGQITTPVYNYMLNTTSDGEGVGIDFIKQVAFNEAGVGSELDTVARLAAFGGMYNSAYQANQTSVDAISSRMGIGNKKMAQAYADNETGAAMWMAPVYKKVNADSFESDGVESGADVDLTGISLGADFTLANSVRVGGMFNLGTGSADGNGIGSSVDNNFDYFGLGVYAGYTVDNFGLVADLTYTQVDNSFDANSKVAGYGKYEADADVKVFSLGATAQYDFTTSFATITPHVGVRYTSLDGDDYDVKSSKGVLAHTDYEKSNVFSIPFGVTVSNDIKTASGWNVKPSFDLTFTANTGDTEEQYKSTFTGAKSGVKLETEYVDSFTYGATLGVDVKNNQGLSLGLGVSYVGSENTNSYGVNGTVRYAF